jgi:hypothetical protein
MAAMSAGSMPGSMVPSTTASSAACATVLSSPTRPAKHHAKISFSTTTYSHHVWPVAGRLAARI